MFQVTLNSSRTGLRILMNRTVPIDINSLDENGTSFTGMDLRMNDDALVISFDNELSLEVRYLCTFPTRNPRRSFLDRPSLIIRSNKLSILHCQNSA